MKTRGLAAVAVFIGAAAVWEDCNAYVITTDEAAFRATYGSAEEILNFTSPRSVRNIYGPGPVYQVFETEFSPDWLFRSTDNAPGHYWTAVAQVAGQYIVPDWISFDTQQFRFFSLVNLLLAEPIALYSGPGQKGFVGIVPDSPADDVYTLSVDLLPRIYKLHSGFVQRELPVPGVAWLLMGGTLGAVLSKRR